MSRFDEGENSRGLPDQLRVLRRSRFLREPQPDELVARLAGATTQLTEMTNVGRVRVGLSQEARVQAVGQLAGFFARASSFSIFVGLILGYHEIPAGHGFNALILRDEADPGRAISGESGDVAMATMVGVYNEDDREVIEALELDSLVHPLLGISPGYHIYPRGISIRAANSVPRKDLFGRIERGYSVDYLGDLMVAHNTPIQTALLEGR